MSMQESREQKCTFCRTPLPKTNEEGYQNESKREAANDPAVFCRMGASRYYVGYYDSAFEYWTKAAELGGVEAHFCLSGLYAGRQGVKAERKSLFIIWKRLPSVVIPTLGAISECGRRIMVG